MQDFYDQTINKSMLASSHSQSLKTLFLMGLPFLKVNAVLLVWDTWW